jgi:hypothetical protein
MANKNKTVTIDEEAVHGADANGDGHVTRQELEMHLEFKRKELEDADAMRDAQRNMAWFALSGMLLYPICVMLTDWLQLDHASSVLGDMAPTYFVSVAAIVAAFYGKEALMNRN